MSTSYAEGYAKMGFILPEVARLLQPYFDKNEFCVYTDTRMRVTAGTESITGSNIWVLAGTIRVVEGYLDNPAYRSLDLHTPFGFSILAHEVFHVYQYYRDGWLKMALGVIKGLTKGLLKGKIEYAHGDVAFEQEAIDFQRKVRGLGLCLRGPR